MHAVAAMKGIAAEAGWGRKGSASEARIAAETATRSAVAVLSPPSLTIVFQPA
jgi:hypothetical protein